MRKSTDHITKAMTTTQRAGLTTLPTSQGDSVRVRLAGRRDQLFVCRIECACFGWGRMLFGLWPRTGRPGVKTWIAEVDGKPAGYVITYARELDGRPVSYVGGIGVLPSFRQSGIATHLMSAVFLDHPTLWLHVRAANRAALNLYDKLDMRELRRLSRFYSNGEDAIVMVTPDLL